MSITTNTTATQFYRLNLKLIKTSSSPNLKSSKPTSPKPVFPCSLALRTSSSRRNTQLRRTMFELIKASSFRDGNNGDEAIETIDQEALVDGSSQSLSGTLSNRIEPVINKLSKWVVSALFAGVIVWRHDGEAVWAAMGSVVNAILSLALKRIINQERPSGLKSDPGMPSSHAQSIFYSVALSILWIVEELGVSDFSLAISAIVLALGSYFSWLRISQRLHTVGQVVVGAIVGSIFSILWYWSWNAFIFPAFVSSLWVRIIVVLVAAGFCVGFAVYVFKHWLKDD